MDKKLNHDDCKKCIRYLLDKTEDGHTRVAAAESLMYCSGSYAKEALFQVLQDESELDYIREEAAGSLGTLWAETGIDYDKIVQINPPLLDEVVCDFDMYHLTLDKEKLGINLSVFIERYGERKFMA